MRHSSARSAVRELLVGKLDPGLHDLTAPRLRARMDVFDRLRLARADPPACRIWIVQCHGGGIGFRRLCGMVNGLVPFTPPVYGGAMSLAEPQHPTGGPGLIRNDWTRAEVARCSRCRFRS